MDDWIEVVGAVLVERGGVPVERSAVLAHLVMAVIRGLMLSHTMVEAVDRPLIREAAELLWPVIEAVIREERRASPQ
jgi:hypothetical protein